MEWVVPLLIVLGYGTLFIYGVTYWWLNREGSIQGRKAAAMATALGAAPWIFFYLPRVYDEASFSEFWRGLSRANHFVTIAAFAFIQWILFQYRPRNGK